MSRFLLLIATFFVLGFTAKEDSTQMSSQRAQELVLGRCQRYLAEIQPRVEEIFKDPECDIASKIFEEYKINESLNTLIYTLDKFLETLPPLKGFSDEEKLEYSSYSRHFRSAREQSEDILSGCLESKVKAKQNHPICRASAEIILNNLRNEQQQNIEKSKAENKETLQRDLIQSPGKVDKVMEEKCKKLLSDPWYNLDSSMQDKECDIALNLSRRNKIAEQEEKIAKQKKELKDKSYFAQNLNEADELFQQCKRGIILNLEECDAAVFTIIEKNLEERKRSEYLAYYSTHQLAAKFYLKWCKDSMLSYTVKCEAADVIVKNNTGKKQKQYNEKIFDKKLEILKSTPEKAKELLKGKCKKIMEDPWYYIDETIRSEECDAAAEIAKMALEAGNGK